jgi:integrase
MVAVSSGKALASANRRTKITKAAVDSVAVPSTGEARIWDTQLTGFCVRAHPSGRRVYALKYRLGGRIRWYTIGEHGDPWTPEAARREAQRLIGRVAMGDDPATEKQSRSTEAFTVARLIELYLAEGPATKPEKRASSWSVDASCLNRHVRPLVGGRLVRDLTRADVGRLVRDVREGRTAVDVKTGTRGRAIVRGGEGIALRVLQTFRAMLTWAAEHEHVVLPENPARGLKLPKRPVVERFLSNAQAAKLFETLARLEAEEEISREHAAIYRLLLLTGARRNEIAGLRWSELDLERGRLVLPPDRTKAGEQGGSRYITLNSMAAEILGEMPRSNTSPFVFPAKRGDGFTRSASKVWRTKVRPAAELAGIRIHDLRHSFASFALADGASLVLIGKALGHKDPRSTNRYLHLSDDPLRALSERVASRVTARDG